MNCICSVPEMGTNPYCPVCYASELHDLSDPEVANHVSVAKRQAATRLGLRRTDYWNN